MGIRDLKDHLSEYVRRARAGERIRVSSHGEVVAELCPPQPDAGAGTPAGLVELERRGTARRIVRNEGSRYRTQEPALGESTARDLLDWTRGDR